MYSKAAIPEINLDFLHKCFLPFFMRLELQKRSPFR